MARPSKPKREARRRAFRVALLREGLTVTDYASRNGVTRQHVNRALRYGEGVARAIHAAIDALIAKHNGGGDR